MKLTLRLIGLVGLLIFAPLFAATFASPIHVERAARGFIESKIKDHLQNVLGIASDKADETSVGRLAGKLADRHKEKLDELKDRLASGLNERIAAEVARMQDLNCECRELLRRGLDAATAAGIDAIEAAEPQLRRLIEGKYVELVSGLMLDLRIFAGTNAVAFLALLILSMTRQDRIRHLFIPGLLLAGAAAIAALFYLFGQNWFFAVLYSDFMGWGYTAFALVTYSFLIDISVFKARVTTHILTALGYAVTSAC